MKGIVLSGGEGTRLFPSTMAVSKQLLPVFDKPMIFYPLSTLMLAGIRDILIICAPSQIDDYKLLLQRFSKIGLNLEFVIQERPVGIADAFILGEQFIGDDDVALILGDNIFFGFNFQSTLDIARRENVGGTIFTYQVSDPERYGILEINDEGEPVAIIEKPAAPKSNHAIVGLYFYCNEVVQIAKSIKPSARGELEITDVNNEFLRLNKLKVIPLGRGFTWMDAGTPDALLEASSYIQSVQRRQGLKICCPEEIAWRNEWISDAELKAFSAKAPGSYGEYLRALV